jgi:hypothetical protein
MDTRTLNPAYFGQGVTLADIEKLTLSAADLDRLTLGKADLADLAPPPLCWRHEPQGVADRRVQLSQDPQGDSNSKAKKGNGPHGSQISHFGKIDILRIE